MTAWVPLSKRARDLDRLRVVPAKLDVRPLIGHAPWRRLRVGEFRVIFRMFSADELRSRGATTRGYLVERIVERRDLDDAKRPL